MAYTERRDRKKGARYRGMYKDADGRYKVRRHLRTPIPRAPSAGKTFLVRDYTKNGQTRLRP